MAKFFIEKKPKLAFINRILAKFDIALKKIKKNSITWFRWELLHIEKTLTFRIVLRVVGKSIRYHF